MMILSMINYDNDEMIMMMIMIMIMMIMIMMMPNVLRLPPLGAAVFKSILLKLIRLLLEQTVVRVFLSSGISNIC